MKPFDFPFTPFHNYILDHIMPSLAPNSWKILCVAIRQTLGWVDKESPTGRKEWDQISYNQFQEKTGIGSMRTVAKAIRECLLKGYLIRVRTGTHPGTGKPIYTYSLNRDFEVFTTTETVAGATTETVAGATTETVAGATTETVVTKETKKQTNGDGDVLTEEQKLSFHLLSNFGVSENVAIELAQRCSLEHVSGWINYTQKAENLQTPIGFLVSKLRSGESVPKSAMSDERENRRQRYIGGKYGDLVQH